MTRRRHNIAHILPWPSVGGTEHATLRIAQAVGSAYESKIFCLAEATALRKMFSDEGFETLSYEPGTPSYRRLNKFLAQSYALAREFKRNKIDIVHCADVLAGFHAATAGRMAGLPVLCHVRSRYDELPRRDRVFLRAVNRFIFVSRDTAHRFACRVPPRKAEIIYDGITLTHRDDDHLQQTRRVVRAEFGLPEHTKIVGMVARVAPLKDFETLAKAAARIAVADPQVRFLIVGDNSIEQVHREHYRRIKHLLAELAVDPFFIFTGFRSDVSRLIAAMDVFVLSTHLEGFPLVILEALAQAKPVVATAVGGIPEIIVDDITGRLFAPRDDRALAAHLASILESRTRAARLGEAGRLSVESKFSSEKFAADMLALYERVIHRKSSGSLISDSENGPASFWAQKSVG
jgi:glycosyltransferase involved in cell wall biosynthesis